MKPLGLKQKLKDRRVTIGSWLSLGSQPVAEIMAQAGYEWLTIDLEHSPASLGDAADMIRVIELSGVAPLVRLSSNDPVQIKRVMDAGAHGIIVPMVNSREEAERAVAALHYPPRGNRGVGLARAQDYGPGFEAYKADLEREAVVVVQIEHIKAVENLAAILSVPGVDAFIVGPYDLSGSLGAPGRFDSPAMVEAMAEIARVGADSPAAPGYHVVPPRPELVREKMAEGYTFIAYSVDFMFLGESARQGLKGIRA